jgi:magnesium-transporting ATPase (P-type)
MATGDNPLTAVSVGRKCGMVMHSNYFIIDLDDHDKKLLKFEKMYNERKSEGSIVVIEEGAETMTQSEEQTETQSNYVTSRRNSRTNSM